MPFENGVHWRPLEPLNRGHHATFGSAVEAALRDLTTEKNEFFDRVVDAWDSIFPDLPAKPGRCEDGYIYLFVTKATTSYVVRNRLRTIRARLAELPGAPKKINLRVEIRS